MDVLVQGFSNMKGEYSIIHELARRRVVKIAEMEDLKLLEELIKERDCWQEWLKNTLASIY